MIFGGMQEGYFQKSEGCESWNCQHLYKKIVDYVCSILCRDERGIQPGFNTERCVTQTPPLFFSLSPFYVIYCLKYLLLFFSKSVMMRMKKRSG